MSEPVRRMPAATAAAAEGSIVARLERLGPAFVILGRFAARRPDLVGESAAGELLRLEDRAPPCPFEDIRAVIAEDLGGAPETLFSTIAPRPFAARALTQVHAARTRDGEEVLIKVARPDAARLVEAELDREREIGRLGAELGLPEERREWLDELRRGVAEELDLGLELRNLTRLHELADRLPRARIPRPFAALSGPRVATFEHLLGVPLSELLSALDSDRPDRLATLRVDPAAVAASLVESLIAQGLAAGFYPVGLLPDDVVVIAGDRVSFAGFAHMEALDPHFQRDLVEALTAVEADDVDRFFDALTAVLVAREHSDLLRLRADFLDRIRVRDAAEPDQRASRYLLGALRAARRNAFTVPPGVLALWRSLAVAETITGRLAGGVPAGAGQPVLRRLRLSGALAMLKPDNLQLAVLDSLTLARDGPRLLRRLLADTVDGRLVLRVRTVESDEDRRQSNARTRLVSTALLSVGLAFLLSATRGLDVFGVPVAWLLWTLLGAAWAWALVQIGRLR